MNTYTTLGYASLFVALILAVAPLASMSIVDFTGDDFENGNFSYWTGVSGSPSIVAEPVFQGSYAAQADAAYDYWYYSFSNGINVLEIEYHFRVSSLSYCEAVYLKAGSITVGTLNVMANGNIRYIYKNGATTSYLPSWGGYSTNLQPNTWYTLKVRHTIDGVDGQVQMWFNGVSIGSVNGIDTDDYGEIKQVEMGRGYGSGEFVATYDNVVVYAETLEVLPATYDLTVTLSSPLTTTSYTVDSQTVDTGAVVTLSEGSHTVTLPSTLSFEGETYVFDSWGNGATTNQITLDLSEDTSLTASYSLSQSGSGVGYLSASATFDGQAVNAEIEVNDETYETTTSGVTVNLQAGTYTVTGTYEGQSEDKQVTILEGETASVSFDFVSDSTPSDDSDEPTQETFSTGGLPVVFGLLGVGLVYVGSRTKQKNVL